MASQKRTPRMPNPTPSYAKQIPFPNATANKTTTTGSDTCLCTLVIEILGRISRNPHIGVRLRLGLVVVFIFVVFFVVVLGLLLFVFIIILLHRHPRHGL